MILDEVEEGLVTRYQILDHPEEHGQAVDAVAHHQKVFAHPPRLVAANREVHSADTEEKLKAPSVERRIASLRRDYGWRKSRYHGSDEMERWLGLGVMASNLCRIIHQALEHQTPAELYFK